MGINRGEIMNIRRGDIWYIASNYATVGSEQRAGRPAVIVSNDRNNRSSQTVEVVYLTTQPKRDLPTHVTIRSIGRESTALCEQVTSIAVKRVGDYICHVSDAEMAGIESAMMISLGIENEPACEETPPPCRKAVLRRQKQSAPYCSRCTMLC